MKHGPQKLLLSAMALAPLIFAGSEARADEYPPHWSFYQTVPAAGYAPVQPVVAPAASYATPAAYAAPVASYPANPCCAPQPVCCQRPVAPVYPQPACCHRPVAPIYPPYPQPRAQVAPVYAPVTALYRPGVIGYQQTVTGYAPATVVGAPRRRYGLFRPPAYLRPVQATSYYAPAYGY